MRNVRTTREHYLLEFRFSGLAREFVRQLIFKVADKFQVRGVTDRRVVPHATLVGPFSMTDERRLVRTLEEVANNYDLLTFRLEGFKSFGNRLTGKRVLAVKIDPSPELEKLRSEFVQNLEHSASSTGTIERNSSLTRP